MKWIVVCITTMLVAASLCGCGESGGVTIKYDTKEYSTDMLDINAQVPKLSGMADREFENSLNAEYEKRSDEWIEEFMASTREGIKGEFKLEQSVKRNTEDFISIVNEIYTYAGGAHGATAWIADNIDVSSGSKIRLADLFSKESDYREVLNRIMQEMVEADSEEYSDLWELPVISDKQEEDFYIEDDKLVIYYHPYELSYYARGFVKFPIGFDYIQSYLKEEYRRFIN